MERSYDMVANPELATGLYVRVHSMMIKDFLAGLPEVIKEKVEVLIDIDGEIAKLTLAQFREAIFPKQKRALQAILIAGEPMRDAVLNGTKKITIREGHRNYTLGPVMIGCHLLNWATLRQIIRVDWKTLKEVTSEEMVADGFKTQKGMLSGLKKFYPEITLDSPITVIEWEEVKTV
jgi:hypothetical protein